MDAVSAATMKQEIKEMSLMLKGIREGAIELIESSSVRSSQTRRLTAEQKRQKSTSSWAKSTSDRSRRLVTDIVPTPDNDVHADVAKSEKVMSKRAASYTFGKRCPEVQKKVSEDVTYDVKIDCSSIRARVKSCVFNKAARLASPKLADPIHTEITRDVPTGIIGEKVCVNDYENSSKPPKSSVISRPSKAYSFPKSAREAASQSNTVGVSGDVEGAEKKLHPHIMGVVMRAPSSTSRIIEEIPLMQDSAIEFFGTSDIIAYIDALSSKGFNPTYTINKGSVRALGGIFNKQKGNPGPGEYNPDIHSHSEPKGAVAYKEKSAVTSAYLLASHIAPRKATPGPGSYEVSTADDCLHEVVSTKFSRLSEAKLTPHLAQKKYWEDKASDARDEFDDMGVVNDSILRSRVPSVRMWDDNIDLSPKRRKIFGERQSERDKMNNVTPYEVSHNLVEKRVQGSVLMEQEMQAIASTKRSMIGKPSVMRVITNRMIQEKDRDQFYGPNLPVAWGNDLVPPRRKKLAGISDLEDDDDDAEDSPTEDIEKFFKRKNKSSREYGKSNPVVSETAEAYLKSSAATGGVPLKSRFNMMIKENPLPMKVALAMIGPELEFLGPQLQMDWVSNLEFKNKQFDLKLGLGRDEILVPKKGQVILKGFNDVAVVTESEGANLGPGAYDVLKGRGMAEGGKGFGVPFSLAIPRNQRIGPNGEKPEYLEEDIADALGEKHLKEDMLAYDYGEAKDKSVKIKSVALYKRERNEPDELDRLPVQDMLGGEHYEGMAELVHKQRSIVDISKMTGRDDNTNNDPFDEKHGTMGQVLELNVIDFKPNMPKSRGILFPDPVSIPRFEDLTIEGLEEDKEILDLNIPQHSAQINIGTKLVDMSKQSGRDLNIPGVKRAEVIDPFGAQEALGSVDRLLSMRLASDKDKAVEQGLALISNYRKIPTVSMKLQSSRTEAVAGNGRPVIDENGDVTNENHILDLNVEGNKTNWLKSAGVEDWNRQAGGDIGKKGIKENLGTILESDELIIMPSDVTTSKYKKEHVGVSWSRDTMPRMDSNNDIQREINDDEDGKLYNDYEAHSGDDIISKRGEINDAGVAWKKGGDTQGRDRGRGSDEGRASAVELMKELMLSDPQSNEQTLDLESDLTTQSKYKRVQVGPSWTSAKP